jgi:addiction module HigA family antidote
VIRSFRDKALERFFETGDGRRLSVQNTIEVGSMTRKLPKRGLPPMHPGQLLREEILPALNRPKTQIARLLGVSRQTLYDLLEENQPVTPIMALRLGKLCGNGPDLRLNLQRRYDLQRASQRLGAKINAIPTLDVA